MKTKQGAIAGNCECCGNDHTHAPTGWNRFEISAGEEFSWLLCNECTVMLMTQIASVVAKHAPVRQ